MAKQGIIPGGVRRKNLSMNLGKWWLWPKDINSSVEVCE